MTSFCLGAAEKTHLQLPAASTRVNFFHMEWTVKQRAEESGGPHPKLDIPVFPSMVHPLLSSQTSQVLFLSMLFPRGTTSVLTSGATAALGWSCANHGFKTSFPVGREKRQTGPTPTFPNHGTRREPHWKQLMGMEISAQLPS